MINDYNNKIIDDELHVAEKFLNHINKTGKRDFVLPYRKKEDVSVDAFTHSESDPKEILKIQIVSSDFEAKQSLGKNQVYIKSRYKTQTIVDTIVMPILHKSRRYSSDFKKEIILLIDGWWTLTKEDLDYFKTHCLDSYLILQDSGFKEIWFSSMKDGGPICRLWPY